MNIHLRELYTLSRPADHNPNQLAFQKECLREHSLSHDRRDNRWYWRLGALLTVGGICSIGGMIYEISKYQ